MVSTTGAVTALQQITVGEVEQGYIQPEPWPTANMTVAFSHHGSVGTLGTGFSISMNVEPLENIRFISPSSHEPHTETTLERYKRLRGDIVAAGIPLLSDEELREEIRERKGVRES